MLPGGPPLLPVAARRNSLSRASAQLLELVNLLNKHAQYLFKKLRRGGFLGSVNGETKKNMVFAV